MRAIWLLGAVLLFLGALAAIPGAEATTTCNASGNWCKGYAHVSTTTGGVVSARCFALRTTNTAPTCTTSGITPANDAWEMVAGACQTFYYFETTTGVATPATPNKVGIQVYNNVPTAVKTYVNLAAPPASGTSYSFCATTDGTVSGAPRAGTYALFVRAVKDNGAGGIGNYDIASNGACSVGTCTNFDNGALRGQQLVSSITRNAYPAGSTFAYGTASDESVTVTATFTQPNGDNNVECMRDAIVDSATLLVGQQGASVDVDAATTLAQSFVADSTFPAASGPYVIGALTGQCNAALTGLPWTVFAATGHGATVVRVSDTFVYDSTTFNMDPGIKFDSDGAGTYATADELAVVKVGSSSGALASVYNKGETFYIEYYVFNARSEKLTRSMTGIREDATATACATATQTPSGAGLYSGTATLSTGSTCAATNDATGAPRYFRFTNTDQNHRSAQFFAVSSLYYVDAHDQIGGTLVKDDFPTENANEDAAYLIQSGPGGVDASDTIHSWCHIKGVRKDVEIDTSGSAVTQTLKDSTTTRLTRTTDTGSDGWTTSQNLLASTPLGAWTDTCSVAYNGNTGSNIQGFTVGVPAASVSGGFPGDPVRVFAVPPIAVAGQVVRFTITESLIDGTARTGNAAATDIYVRDPSHSVILSAAHPTETAYGAYYYDYTAPSTAGAYDIVVRTTDPTTMNPVGSSNGFSVQAGWATAADVSAAVSSINGHTDTALGSSVSTINGHTDSTLASAVSTIDGHTDTEVALILDAIADASDLSSGDHADLMERLDTLVANGTFENATLAAILVEVQEHRAHTIEVDMTNDFYGMGFDGFLMLVFFTAIIVVAGFLTVALIRSVLVGLAGAGIFVSWLTAAPIGVKGIIALIASVVVVFILTRAWRERQDGRDARGE